MSIVCFRQYRLVPDKNRVYSKILAIKLHYCFIMPDNLIYSYIARVLREFKSDHMTEGQSMKQIAHEPARLIAVTEHVCSLLAMPTQSWAEDVAQALANISQDSLVGVLIADIRQGSETTRAAPPVSGHVSGLVSGHTSGLGAPEVRPISTGVACAQPDRVHTLSLQDKLERMNLLGFSVPEHGFSRGLVAPLRALNPNWKSTSVGQAFIDESYQSPIVMMIPIVREKLGFVLVCYVGIHQQSDQDTPDNTLVETNELARTLGQLVPLLSSKAHVALEHVQSPKAWLTHREQEVLEELILGHSVRVIAERMERSAHTVHDHVKNLHKKLGASSRGELIAKALGYRVSTQSTEPFAPNPIVFTDQTTLAELKPTKREQAAPLAPTELG